VTTKHPEWSRRTVLQGGASALVGANLAGAAESTKAPEPVAARALPAYVAWKDPAALIVHTSSTIETRREAFGASVITPAERLYVRNNLPAPDASILEDRDGWSLSIEGVATPRTLTVGELKTLGLETLPMVLQCSGNGRGFFPSKPSGTPWQVGAAGCVIWTGVPVRTVVAALGGVPRSAHYITGTGGEPLPAGVDPKSVIVERSVPIEALADALLAWEMNGAPLSLAHGGPLRLIVPGYTGVNNVKYIKRLAFTETESDARIMAHNYRVSPPGEKADPSHPSVLGMTVKSWINAPSPGARSLRAGRVQVHGVAFGGLRAVRRVDVSVDGGKTWRKASFVGPDLGRFAWRQFVLPVDLTPGPWTLASRAVDTRGEVQPRDRLENHSGYNNTSWLDHAVSVTVT
jgi:sulfite dehydrogenase